MRSLSFQCREDLGFSPFIFHSLEQEGKPILLKIGWIDDYGGAKWFLILWRAEVKQQTRYKKVRVEWITETEKEWEKGGTLDGKKYTARDRNQRCRLIEGCFLALRRRRLAAGKDGRQFNRKGRRFYFFFFWEAGHLLRNPCPCNNRGTSLVSSISCRLPVATHSPPSVSIAACTFRRRYRKILHIEHGACP